MDNPLPKWSAWRGQAPSSPYTLGIEEEVMLLDPDDWSLANRSDEVIATLPSELRPHVRPETHAAVIELATGVHDRVEGAVAELAHLRSRLSLALEHHGLRAATAGTHPCAVWNETVVSSDPRYQNIEESMRVLAKREPTLAMHVHVGVPTPHVAIRAANRMRAHLPLLLALSANSPFWQGRATGLASSRTPVFGAFPRSGMPRRFRSYRDWAEAIDLLIRAGAIADPSFMWWDLRLQPRLGTLEVRIMDSQTTVEAVAAIAALVQCLVRLEAEHPHASTESVEAVEAIDENRFLAARDGMDALFIDVDTGERIPAVAQLELMITACRRQAELLGCEPELAATRVLAAANGAARQVDLARRLDLPGLVSQLAEEFSSTVATAQASYV